MSSPAPVDSVLHAIGHTPILRLRKIVPPGSADVVVKLEYFNPTGSYQDRMALVMIEGAEKRGALRRRRRFSRPVRAALIGSRHGCRILAAASHQRLVLKYLAGDLYK